MPSHQDRRQKHPPPLQKTPPTGTVAKNTKTSHRRKKHELPTQKTRNPIYECFIGTVDGVNFNMSQVSWIEVSSVIQSC